MNNNRPQVGIGVMIIKDGKILMGKRKSSHGAGEYSLPGGHLEYIESFEDCAKREVQEEVAIEIKNVKFLHLANLKDYAPKHYVNICLVADWKSGEPQVMEPEKLESWNWYDMDSIPQPCFKTIPWLIDAYKTGKNYLDA